MKKLSLLFIACLSGLLPSPSLATPIWSAADPCERRVWAPAESGTSSVTSRQIRDRKQAVLEIRQGFEALGLGTGREGLHWMNLLDHFVIPNIDEEIPLLLAAIIGGGNSGKSTLLNSIPALLSRDPLRRLGQPISQTGFYAGLTKRMVLAVPPHLARETSQIPQFLRQRFGELVPLKSPSDSLREGPSLITSLEELPPNLAFADSPDFDTGGPMSLEPDNLQRALKVLESADVLIYMFTPQNFRALGNVRLMKEAFRRFGERKLILIYQADPAIDPQEALAHTLEVANTVFQRPTLVDFPEGLVGAYLMPYAPEVARGDAHPELWPMPGFKEFPDLMEELSATHEDVKRFATDHAIRQVVAGAADQVRRLHRQSADLFLYKVGLEHMIRGAARDAVEPFPYRALRDYVRQIWMGLSSDASHGLRRAGDVVARPEREAIQLFRTLTRGQPQDVTNIRNEEQDFRIRARVSITRLIRQIEKNAVTLVADSDTDEGEALINLIRNYRRMYNLPPGAYPDVVTLKKGVAEIRLPTRDQLPRAVQEAIHRIQSSDPGVMEEELVRRMEHLRPYLSNRAEREFKEQLQKLRSQRGPLRRLNDVMIPFLTLAVPAGYSLSLIYSDIWNLWQHAVGATLLARPFHYWDQRRIDRLIQRRLDDWYRERQMEEVLAYYKDHIINSLEEQIRQVQPPDAATIRRINEALLFLDPNYEPIEVIDEPISALNPDPERRGWWRRLRELRPFWR